MRIDIQSNYKQVSRISSGDTFEYLGHYYIKAFGSLIIGTPYLYGVNISNGELKPFKCNDLVVPIKGLFTKE